MVAVCSVYDVHTDHGLVGRTGKLIVQGRLLPWRCRWWANQHPSLIRNNVNQWESSSGFLYHVKCHPGICFIVENCRSNPFHIRFLGWIVIIWITGMSFIGCYINYWDLMENSWLTWQACTCLSPFQRQHDSPPKKKKPPCSYICAGLRDHSLLVTTFLHGTTFLHLFYHWELLVQSW